MKAIKRTAIILALGLAAGGCSVIETKSVAREDLKNAQGHVVGYEERVRGGAVLRDLNGKRIGGSWHDLRSGKGLVIMVRGKQTERVTMAEAPSIDDLIHLARLAN